MSEIQHALILSTFHEPQIQSVKGLNQIQRTHYKQGNKVVIKIIFYVIGPLLTLIVPVCARLNNDG